MAFLPHSGDFLSVRSDVDISKLGGNVVFIGTAMSTFLSGVVVCQGFTYVISNRDRLLLRLFVCFTIIIDLGNTICKNMVLHYFTISHFGDLSRFLPRVERTVFLPTEMLLSLTVVFIVEIFFASRVYLLRTTHWSIPSVIGIFAAVAYAFGLVVCANEYKDPWITFDRPSQINFGLTVAFSALSDIIATLAIWWSCRRSKIGFKKSHSIVNKLVEYIVTRGILVTLFQIVYLVIFLAKTASLEWTVFQIAMSKVYVITMIAMSVRFVSRVLKGPLLSDVSLE